MDLATGRTTLVDEARDLLAGMEGALLEIETNGQSDERINAVFRAAHTIKGSAGLFGLTLIERFTQRLENLLDLVRAGSRKIDGELMSLLLRSGDYIARLVDAIENFREAEDPDPVLRQALLDELAAYSHITAELRAFVPVEKPAEKLPAAPAASEGVFHLSIQLAPNALDEGVCPDDLLRHLRERGELLYVLTRTAGLPARDSFVPQRSYLGFEVGLRAHTTIDALSSAFALAGDAVALRIYPPSANPAERLALLAEVPELRPRLEEKWRRAGLAFTPAAAGETETEMAPVPVEVPSPGAPPPERAKAKQAEEKRPEQRMVKVDAGRLDQLINLVGELVIASEGARTSAASSSARREDLLEAMGRVSQLVEHIRDRALNMRMTPIGDVFQRFPRVVRDVAKELNKQIDLEITGAEAELDKSLVERLSDPLLHIVRNAIDHGIEPVRERLAAGKPASGNLRLNAYHESGCIVIEIKDDGRGLDPVRLRKKAIERGLIAEDAALGTSECFQLIFLPGFSTAATVTNLSGRGVGMDVVKRSLEAIRGEIEIESAVGKGTTFRLRLPLTLAIIDGFHVEVAGTTFVIPLDLVVECVDAQSGEGGRRIANLRGEVLPYVRLREVFQLGAGQRLRESLVVVSYGHQRVGLVVDRLLGNSQAVIKPLGQIFRGLHGISSSTILGDGSVALILDIPGLISAANQNYTFDSLGADVGAREEASPR